MNYASFLQEETTRHAEAEQEFRKLCENDREPTAAWFNLGNLLKLCLHRPDEAETAYRNSIKADVNYAPAYMGLALLYREQGKAAADYRPLAVKAMTLPPYRAYDLCGFMRLCADDSDSIREALPHLCRWCGAHPDHLDLPMVYGFAFSMWMRLADLIRPDGVLDFMKSLPEADLKPFEALADVFHTMKDPSHLQRLAPERARFVSEVLAQKSKPARRGRVAER